MVYAFSVACAVVVYGNLNDLTHITGEFTALGVLGFGATSVLNFSIEFYSSKESESAESSPQRLLLWNRTTVASLCISTLSASLFIMCEAYRSHPYAPSMIHLAVIGNTLAAGLTHLVNGLEGYQKWMPFSGGFQFTLIQAFGWFFLAFFYQSVICLPAPQDKDFMHLKGIISLVGGTGLTGNLLLLFSLSRFNASDLREPAPGSPGASWDLQRDLAFNREAVYALSITIASSVALGFLYIMSVMPLHDSLSRVGFDDMSLKLSRVGLKVLGSISSSLMLDNAVCFTSLVMLLSTPLAHISGLRTKSYRLYQPFEGGVAHISLQAFGWLLYAWAVCVLSIWHTNRGILAASGHIPPFTMMTGASTIMVLASVKV